MERLLEPKEVSELLGIHLDTVRRYLREGKIKAIKLGNRWRIRESDLDKFLDTE